jgi:hypothetical protein
MRMAGMVAELLTCPPTGELSRLVDLAPYAIRAPSPFATVMDQPPLAHLLDGVAGGEDDAAALQAVLGRRRRQRAAGLRAATACLLLAAAGTGLGLGLSASSTGLHSASAGPSGGSRTVHGTASHLGTGSAGPAAFGGEGPATSGVNGIRAGIADVCSHKGCSPGELVPVAQLGTRTVGRVTVTSELVRLSRYHGLPAGTAGSGTSSVVPASGPSAGILPLLCPGGLEVIVRVEVGRTVEGYAVLPGAPAGSGAVVPAGEVVVGAAGSEQVVVVAAKVAPSVETVEARFTAGPADTAHPVASWVVLVGRPTNGVPAASLGVTLVARSRTGRTASTVRLAGPDLNWPTYLRCG